MDRLVELLGPPTSSFTADKSHWWSSRTADDAIKAMRLGAKSFPVYAHPNLVEGGQRYDLNYREG